MHPPTGWCQILPNPAKNHCEAQPWGLFSHSMSCDLQSMLARCSFAFREAIMGQAIMAPYYLSLDESSLILFSFFNNGIKKCPEKKKRSSEDSTRLQTPDMCWLSRTEPRPLFGKRLFSQGKEKRTLPFPLEQKNRTIQHGLRLSRN